MDSCHLLLSAISNSFARFYFYIHVPNYLSIFRRKAFLMGLGRTSSIFSFGDSLIFLLTYQLYHRAIFVVIVRCVVSLATLFATA
jgi:hypothetical protein